MTLMPLHDTGTPVAIDHAAILRALRLNPSDPKTQALLVVCDRYNLDPILRHMVLVDGNPYVTRDGLLHVAHSSRQFDGMVVDEMGENDEEWTAKVSVYRKDMSRPFTYPGRYSKKSSNKKYGPEMALKCAEVMALRRAFDVTGIAVLEEQDDKHDAVMDSPQLVSVSGDGDGNGSSGPHGALSVVSPAAAANPDENPEWKVGKGWAKKEILAAVGHDADRAGQLWEEHFEKRVSDGEELTVGLVRAFIANLPDEAEDATGDEVEIVDPDNVAGDVAPVGPPTQETRAQQVAKRAAHTAKKAASRGKPEMATGEHIDTILATELDDAQSEQLDRFLAEAGVEVKEGVLTLEQYQRVVDFIDVLVDGGEAF